MTHDEVIRAKMEEAFRTRPWSGFITKEEALTQLLCYRDGLTEAEQALYDEQILSGRHPSYAAETVGLMKDAGVIPAAKSFVLNKVGL